MDPATNKIMQSSHCRPRSVPMLLNLSFQFVFQRIVLHAMYFWWLLVTGGPSHLLRCRSFCPWCGCTEEVKNSRSKSGR